MADLTTDHEKNSRVIRWAWAKVQPHRTAAFLSPKPQPFRTVYTACRISDKFGTGFRQIAKAAGIQPKPDRLAGKDRPISTRSTKKTNGCVHMLLLIDNYDSFTYNLVHYLGELGADVRVVRNDAMSVQDALALRPELIVLSPGPCDPAQAGICVPLTKAAAMQDVPLLGVCLGHQTIGEAFGGDVIRCHEIVHGKMGLIHHKGAGMFRDLPTPFSATRYHSLVVDPATLPAALEVTAWLQDGTIMGLRHREKLIEGVQFHPESIASEHGHHMLRNFLDAARARVAA